MNPSKRQFFQASFALILSSIAQRIGAKPTADALQGAVQQASGGQPIAASDAIILEIPEIAENGAIVPVTVDSRLSAVESVWVLVEKNPVPLVARFDLDPSLDPFVSLRVKMNESGDVVVLMKTQAGYFSARKTVRVMLGGCG